MNCPECGTENTRVVDTFKGATERRHRRCACGVTFKTTETVDKNSIRVPLVPISSNRSQPNGDQSRLIPTESQPIGEKPILSDPDPVRSDSGSLSDLRLDLSQRVDRARVYEPEFLAFWDAIEPIGRRKGDKAEAQKVWTRKGKPNSAELVEGWRRYRISCGDGYTMDADRWLRKDGWRDEYEVPNQRRIGSAVDKKFEEHRQVFEEGRAWAAGGDK